VPSFYKLSFQHWRHLPASVQAFYDVEDMVGDVILSLWTVWDKFDPERGVSIGTYLYTCAQNQCRSIVGHYAAQKRFPGVTQPMETMEAVLLAPQSELEVSLACRMVEAFIREAEGDLGTVLDNVFRLGSTAGLQSAAKQLREIARAQHLSRKDFELAMAAL